MEATAMRRMTSVSLALAALALAACGPKPTAKEAAPAAVAAAGAGAAAPVEHGGAWLKRYDDVLPDWILIAHTATGGFVQYNRKTVKYDEPARIADVWLQILHDQPQTFRAENETTERITTYNKERFLYRLNCKDRRFTIAERDILGANDIVVEKVATPPMKPTDWRPIMNGGPAEALEGPICRT
jgi:hypothetical protein